VPQRSPSASDRFPADVEGLPASRPPQIVELSGGDEFDLRIGAVSKRLGEATVRMLAYNGSIPGPTLRVPQGSEVVVNVANEGDLESTVHWHGVRLENRYDGTHETQAPIAVGERFTYRVRFDDPGVYWYHPHVREDYGQELGLYGNVLVVPTDPDYWAPVNREVVLTLDDVLLEDGKIAPFSRSETTHVAMGRFGNTMLIGGELEPTLGARLGEVVRFYLTNTANTRVFNVRMPGTRMKLVGGDSGRCEHEAFVDEVLVAPSERAVVDVLFDQPGRVTLEHCHPDRSYPLAVVDVTGDRVVPSLGQRYEHLRSNADLVVERQRVAPLVADEPDKTLALVAEMDMGESMHDHHHMHHGAGEHDETEAPGGIEWEDEMAAMNRMTTPANMRWKIVDRATGAENQAIDWRFRVGGQVKIRLVNELESDHPMHHPFHIHGAGRFLVLARDGVAEPNLVWKDTVLVRAGETVDILLDVTNPGVWMAHCHIAEHHEGGMMFSFRVE
jgi:FtsP/CotA-like multicopper oxidase with cupredoxin domain